MIKTYEKTIGKFENLVNAFDDNLTTKAVLELHRPEKKITGSSSDMTYQPFIIVCRFCDMYMGFGQVSSYPCATTRAIDEARKDFDLALFNWAQAKRNDGRPDFAKYWDEFLFHFTDANADTICDCFSCRKMRKRFARYLKDNSFDVSLPSTADLPQ
jgi:hypothetical protein